MSGEITLKGKVLPVGGIKEKLLAAHREGIHEVLIPAANKTDLKDTPKNIKDDMTIHLVENMNEVLSIALTKELPEKMREDKTPVPAKIEKGKEGEGPQDPPITH
jgi:ATP-dependent Lon protease